MHNLWIGKHIAKRFQCGSFPAAVTKAYTMNLVHSDTHRRGVWPLVRRLSGRVSNMIEGRHYSVPLVSSCVLKEAASVADELLRAPQKVYSELVRGRSLPCGPDLTYEALSAAEKHPDCPRKNDAAGAFLTRGLINFGTYGKYYVGKSDYAVSAPSLHSTLCCPSLHGLKFCRPHPCRASIHPLTLAPTTLVQSSSSRHSQTIQR